MAIVRFDFAKAKQIIREKEEAKMLIACEVVEAEAKMNLNGHVKTGYLLGAFSHEVESNENEIIGRINNSSEYAADVEFDTKPHDIKPKNKKALSFMVNGIKVITKIVHHPGTKGVAFLRGAMAAKKIEVKEILDL
jgi:hypothetical protein